MREIPRRRTHRPWQEAQAQLQAKQLALEVRKAELLLKVQEVAKAAKTVPHQELM